MYQSDDQVKMCRTEVPYEPTRKRNPINISSFWESWMFDCQKTDLSTSNPRWQVLFSWWLYSQSAPIPCETNSVSYFTLSLFPLFPLALSLSYPQFLISNRANFGFASGLFITAESSKPITRKTVLQTIAKITKSCKKSPRQWKWVEWFFRQLGLLIGNKTFLCPLAFAETIPFQF